MLYMIDIGQGLNEHAFRQKVQDARGSLAEALHEGCLRVFLKNQCMQI